VDISKEETRLSVLIMCAGMSRRMNSTTPKPYILIKNKPVLQYSAEVFFSYDYVDRVYFVINKEHIEYFRKAIEGIKVNPKYGGFIIGGSERGYSVLNGLNKLREYKNTGFVAIHDAARPFLSEDVLAKTYLASCKYGGAAPAIEVTDTIKVVDSEGFIGQNLVRKSLRAVQTPQIFDFIKLLNIYNSAKRIEEITDDTEVFVSGGNRVFLTHGSRELNKLTYQEDLDLFQSDHKIQ